MGILGISSYGCFLVKNQILIVDYMSSLSSTIDKIVCFKTGSFADGTYMKGSDTDILLVMTEITVYTTSKKIWFTKGLHFSLDEVGSSSGYGRLRLLKPEDTDYEGSYFLDASFRDLLQETKDGKFLSSEKLVNVMVRNLKTKLTECYRHGPCATTEEYGSIEGNPDFKIEKDIAMGLVCDEWPLDAQKWITRKRRHDWPPKNIIEKISKMKCHMVPVGNSRSGNFSLEWRISFSLGERELVWNFNDTQVQCYVLLKQLIKKNIEPIAPDQLSSYHIKTIMFWMAEEQGMSMWYKENLLGCVTECLNRLSHCVNTHKLKHYFYAENNLLDNKLDNRSDKEHLLQKIGEIQADIEQYACDCLGGYEIITTMCNSCQNSHKNLTLNTKTISFIMHNFEQTLYKIEVGQFYTAMFSSFASIMNDLYTRTLGSPSHLLESVCRNPPEEVDVRILKMIIYFIFVRTGMSFCGNISVHEDTSMSMQIAYSMLSLGRYLDSVSGTLYLASIYLCEGKFSLSKNLVLSVLRTGEPLFLLSGEFDFIEAKGNIFPVFHVIFSPFDVNCVPYPVKFECVLAQKDMHLYSSVTIHPFVYAYFLLCFGQFCDGQYGSFVNTLEQLEQLVCKLDHKLTKSGKVLYVYRALNLLGYCYSLGGNVNAALKCYSRSLKLTQSHPIIENAAVYHICIILVKNFNAPRHPEVLEIPYFANNYISNHGIAKKTVLLN